jgi:hypothetical protein
MPIIQDRPIFKSLGMRKVWKEGITSLNYSILINNWDRNDDGGLNLVVDNFWIQCLNCFMICSLSLQTEIFYSSGY